MKKANTFYCMTLGWNYTAEHVKISLPGYIDKALQKFTRPKLTRTQPAASKWSTINCTEAVKYAHLEHTSLPLDKSGITKLQQIICTLLSCAGGVDNTMLVTLGTLAAAQSW
jgi:hypothetical protein